MAYYFASDFHLGVDARKTSSARERQIVAWIDAALTSDAEGFYLLGDLFEFWFEWKRVVPRGYVRFLGKLAEITDAGLPLHVFTGNHDLWMRDYLEKEIGATVHHRPIKVEHHGHKLLLGHGDGLGPGDLGYKRLKKVFTAGWAQWLYARLHPNFAMSAAHYFSSKSRSSQPPEKGFLDRDREWLVAYAERKLLQDPELDVCVFGHRHLPIDLTLSNGRSRYVNLGEWLEFTSYGKLDERGFVTTFWDRPDGKFYTLS